MNTCKIRTKITIAAVLLFSISVSYGGESYCLYQQETQLPVYTSEHFSALCNYGSSIYMQIDSGSNWKNVTIGINCYLYGTAKIDNTKFSVQNKAVIKEASADQFMSIETGTPGLESNPAGYRKLFPSDLNVEPAALIKPILPIIHKTAVIGENPVKNYHPAKVNFLVRVTGIISMHFKNTDGNHALTVTRGKLIKSLCNLKINGIEILNNSHSYKTVSDEEPFTSDIKLP